MFQVKNREHLEALEESTLAPYATRGRLSKGRRHREEEHPYQSVYQRDRDRIIHSNAFRRLEYKTQVFVYYEGDHYRNRLSHSLEVAVVGRSLARMLQLNEDLIEAIALAHDLGHSPFGHSGERVLDDVMGEWGGFEHNRQSLRVVEIIEHRHPGFRGLNLTWEVREGMAKHSSEYDQPLDEDYGPGRFPSLEAQVVNLSDEIAYTNHDLDDGLNSGLLSPRRLGEVPLWGEEYREAERLHSGEGFRQICYATIRRLINLLVENAARTTLGNVEEMGIESPDDVREAPAPAVALEGNLEGKFGELKSFLNENLYQHYRVRRMAVKAERVLRELFTLYSTDQSLLPGNLKVHLAGDVPERVICDYLAGMTDRYAIREYRKLFNPEENI
jgi:dGTPase